MIKYCNIAPICFNFTSPTRGFTNLSNRSFPNSKNVVECIYHRRISLKFFTICVHGAHPPLLGAMLIPHVLEHIQISTFTNQTPISWNSSNMGFGSSPIQKKSARLKHFRFVSFNPMSSFAWFVEKSQSPQISTCGSPFFVPPCFFDPR